MASTLLSRLGHAAIRTGLRGQTPQGIKSFEQKSQLATLLKKYNINCVFDIGANRGWFSASLRGLGFQGDIFSFEPIRSDHDEIAQMAAGDEKWHTFPFALGDVAETKDFTIIESNGETVLSSFLGDGSNLGHSSKTESMEIKTIDGIAGELPFSSSTPRVFLKTDTQGYDINVVKGAAQTLKDVHLLQAELAVGHLYKDAPHYTEALSFYEGLGFRLIDLHVISRLQDGSVLEYDCIMGKSE